MITENEMIVTNENGEQKTMKVLFTYGNDARNHDYVYLCDPENEDDVLVFIYNEDDLSLQEIEDYEEYAEAEEVFNAFVEENLI